MSIKSFARKIRKPTVEISPLFYSRWSPRAMSGEEMSKEELLPLFEAARWAPSSYNNQPWRFIVAHTQKEKEKFMGFSGEFNQIWCKNASALVILISSNNFEHNGYPAKMHSFDSGAAWVSLALEGARRNLVVHGMEGFDYDKVKKDLSIPEDYTVEMMIAIGKIGKTSFLPKEMADREIPSDRKPLNEIISWDGFRWKKT